MDGAARQREMTDSIRSEVREGASARRERRARTRGQVDFIVTSGQDYESEPPSPDTPVAPRSEEPINTTSETQQVGSNANSITARAVYSAQSLSQGHVEHSPPSSSGNTLAFRAPVSAATSSILNLAIKHPGARAESSIQSLPRAWELDFIMMYLDYVFPFLFPFYHPSLASTSRAWLLTFLRQSDSVLHSVISLSSYFFTVGLNEVFPGKHENCKKIVWDQVLKQADLSFSTVHRDLAEATGRPAQATLQEKVRLMESIIQLLIFETFLGRSVYWQAHLTPALALFEEMLKQHAQPPSDKPAMLCLLEALAWEPGFDHIFGRLIWNPDQAGFRFFTAVLVFVDIVASTSLERAPQLGPSHSGLLGELKPNEVDVPIDLAAFLGCQNWPLLAVGEIAALDAWKKEMKRDGSLSMPDLVDRARQISQNLARGLERLDQGTTSHAADSHGFIQLQPHYSLVTASTANSSLVATRVWAHAARIYLTVVTSGWQTSNAELRRSVAEVLALLQSVESPAQMRALAWPICVSGCLAEAGEQQERFQSTIADIGDQQTLNALREAREIMEAVWRNRDSLDRETWDLAACFRVLGSPALLV